MNSIIPSFYLAEAAPANSPLQMLVPFVLMGVLFYFLLIRPQTKQRKAQMNLINSLKTGDKVVTTSGIHGIISNVKERTLLLKIADNVKIEIDKAAIVALSKEAKENKATEGE